MEWHVLPKSELDVFTSSYVLEDVFASGTLTRNVVRVRALLRPVKYTEVATHAKGGNRNTTKKVYSVTLTFLYHKQ